MNQEPPLSPMEPAPAPQMVRLALPDSAPYVTYSLIGATVFVYLLQLASQAFLTFDFPVGLLAKSNDLIRDGQLWRLFTPALVHGGIAHIGFNMYALLIFGVGLERAFGHGRFLLLYVLGAFAGNVMSFLFTTGVSVGASTAIFGLIGAELVFLIQNRKIFPNQFRSAIGNVIFIIFVNLFMGLAPSIDNWGHVGGLFGGVMFASFAGPLWNVEGIPPMLQLVDQREPRSIFTGAVVTAVIFGALAVWGLLR
ncbi:MAG: rhomboid family intramembrane serine protease [Anaerolineales bacterium]|nr:rhomboid family intramembrane serine protease [Anaerolineales bacterium]